MNPTKPKDNKTGSSIIVPAVEQASRILLCLAKNTSSKTNLTDICKEVGIHKSKGYTILNTLLQFGFVQRDGEDKHYSLGPGLLPLSRKVLDNLDYKEVAQPLLEHLARETGSPAFFGLRAGENIYVIGKHEGSGDIGITIRLGLRYPLTHGAHGKAIVAFLPESEEQKILAKEKLYFHGEPSRLNRARLKKELARCRKEGYAEDLGELNPNINAVAAPVFASSNRLVGVIFLVGLFPKSAVKEFGRKVAEKACLMSTLLGAELERIKLRRT
jgi:DNA-binding IclR family transcriptional regulator